MYVITWSGIQSSAPYLLLKQTNKKKAIIDFSICLFPFKTCLLKLFNIFFNLLFSLNTVGNYILRTELEKHCAYVSACSAGKHTIHVWLSFICFQVTLLSFLIETEVSFLDYIKGGYVISNKPFLFSQFVYASQ